MKRGNNFIYPCNLFMLVFVVDVMLNKMFNVFVIVIVEIEYLTILLICCYCCCCVRKRFNIFYCKQI